MLSSLQKLSVCQLQENKLRVLPAELHLATSLSTLGLDWFQFTNPPLSVVQASETSLGRLKCLSEAISKGAEETIAFKTFVFAFNSGCFDPKLL